MADNSHIQIYQRIAKSEQNPFGCKDIDIINPDIACVVALPGSETDDARKANGFAKMVQNIINDKQLPLFSVKYDLAGRSPAADRFALLHHYDQCMPGMHEALPRPEADDYIPQYVHELYQKTLAPRLRTKDGKKAPIALVAQRLNAIPFVNHCQGSLVSFQLELLCRQDMKELGYPDKTADYLLKQIHNVDISPIIPYGITKTSTIKFLSLSDEIATGARSKQIKHILERKAEHERFLENLKQKNTNPTEKSTPFTMDFSVFFPQQNETIFAVNQLYPTEIYKDKKYEDVEHSFDSYSEKYDAVEKENDEIIPRSKQGNLLNQMLTETINWVTENAQKNEKELTELKDITKEPRLASLMKIAQRNRYNFITKETRITRSRRSIPNKKNTSR